MGAGDFFAPDPLLRQYVEQALNANPSVLEALDRHEAALAHVPQVTALPDPVVSVGQSIRTPETRVGALLNTFTISQTFPWAGKRRLRGEVATQEAAALQELYVARQRDVIAHVKRAFYDVAYVDAAIAIAQEEHELLDHYEQLAQVRYATGQGLQQAVIKIQAEITKVTSRLATLGQQRTTLVARLNTLMNRPPDEPIPPVSMPQLPVAAIDLTRLYQTGEAHRPELLASQALIDRNERAIDLARRAFWPDVSFGVSYGNILGRDVTPVPPDNGKNTLSLSIGINIPIRRGKLRAGVEQAARELSAQHRNHDAVRNEVEFAIRDQAIRLETLGEQVRLFDNVLIPQAEEALRSTEAAYQTGQLGVLELLDSERILLQVRVGNARQRADALVALADLEHAVGAKFPQ